MQLSMFSAGGEPAATPPEAVARAERAAALRSAVDELQTRFGPTVVHLGGADDDATAP